jgi:hypothetical protein
MEEEHPTEDAETMRDATGTERVEAEKAQQNYENARAEADASQSAAAKTEAKNKETAKNEANAKLNRASLESLNGGKKFTDAEWDKLKNTLDDILGVEPIDTDNVSQTSVDNARTTASKIPKDLSPDVRDSLNKATKSMAEVISDKTLKELSSSDQAKIKDSQSKIEQAANDLADGINKGDIPKIRDALETISKEKKNCNDILENNKNLKEKATAEGGRNGWEWTKAFSILGKLLTALAPLGLVLLGLKMIGDSLTGCYKYDGTTKTKIGCPSDINHQEYCSCGVISKMYYQPTDKNTACGSGQLDIMKYPFCCGSQITNPTIPLCSDPKDLSKAPGDNGYVYYGYEQVSASDVLAHGVQTVIDALKDAFGELFKILKWVAIGIGILFVIFIGFKLFSGFFNKKENDHEHQNQNDDSSGHYHIEDSPAYSYNNHRIENPSHVD